MPAIDIPYNSLTTSQKGKRKPGTYRDDTPMDGAPPFVQWLAASGALDFGATIATNVTEDRTLAATGIETTDIVAVSPEGVPGPNCQWSAWVSAADTITVRLSNVGTGTEALTNRTWRAVVTRI
jgi:hypothetical protein